MSTLVIVESPAKAKTIGKFLGKGYKVLSSFGHVRDLPKNKIGVDIANNFEPQYVVSREKSPVVKELKEAAKKSDGILFATDEDREGEAISWHLAQILGVKPEKAKRIAFHEITKTAILKALEHPQKLDLRMVNAQQARRVLDRLVGYELSPFLWHKVAKGLSAGRVQSVAVRLVVEKEREIQNFKTEEYWTVEGTFESAEHGGSQTFKARLNSIKNKILDKFSIKDKAGAEKITAELSGAAYQVADIGEKRIYRHPSPAFITSTLQQDANNHLGFSAKQTMRLAQQLYEGVELGDEGSIGLITYMRTDSVILSEKFLEESKELIGKNYGPKYQLRQSRLYHNKSKNAQEAHEAIRPTEVNRTPESLQPWLDKNQLKLYDLIWRRAVSTQMASAEINLASIDIVSDNSYGFRATGQTIIFDGFLKLYPDRAKENLLPSVVVKENMKCLELLPEQHFTEPPSRYSDATLIKALESYGIGRPSTYAPTVATIEDRGYIERDDRKKLKPKEIAFLVNDLLVEHFPHIVDYRFTAEMEEGLDEVAKGVKEWQPLVKEFYDPFKATLIKKDKELNKKDIAEEATKEICEKCGAPFVIKTSRFGKFLACSGFPKCKNIRTMGGDGAHSVPEEPTNEKCEKCGAPMVKKMGRYGAFLSCSAYPECKNIKSIEIKTNVKCPRCGEGEIIERHSKRGKIFFSCNRYPACEYALWDKPLNEFCPVCGELLVYGAKGVIKCSSKTCDYKK